MDGWRHLNAFALHLDTVLCHNHHRSLILAGLHTDQLVDCDFIKHIEGRVQLERLTAALAHEAHLHGGARRLGALHR